MPIANAILMIILGYLLGSIPFDYLAAKLVNGVDLRRVGSGTPSGSMLYEHVRRWLVVPVGILDVAKGALPTYLGLKLGLGEAVAAAAGIAAMIGHNWPIFLRFIGGRGISTLLGALFVLFPWGDAWLLGFLAVGFLLKDSAPFALVSVLSMPALVLALGGSIVVIGLIGAAVLIMLIKRLEANRRPLPPCAAERRRVIWMRLLLDRDMLDHRAWIRREL